MSYYPLLLGITLVSVTLTIGLTVKVILNKSLIDDLADFIVRQDKYIDDLWQIVEDLKHEVYMLQGTQKVARVDIGEASLAALDADDAKMAVAEDADDYWEDLEEDA